MYSTILFDFDGTLTLSLDAWLVAFQKTFTSLGKSVTNEVIIERCFYRAFEEIVIEFGLPCAIEFKELLHLWLAETYGQVKLVVGVKEILQECKNRKIKLAVVTSAPAKPIAVALRVLDIESFFSTVVTADDVTNFKPHPEPVLLALKHLGSDASDTLFVGDSLADLLAGRAAGTRTALFFPEVHKAFYDFQKLIDARPDFVFGDYAELDTHLRDRYSLKENQRSIDHLPA
jgi:pyrophosphatase PpaX